jgi:membrane-bound serine protease (ClpP class)
MKAQRRSLSLFAALAWLCLPIAAIARPSVSAAPSAPALDPAKAVVIRLSGEVDDYVRNNLYRNFAEARANRAGTVILEIDTYGGLVTSGLDISRFLRRQNDIHVIAFVHDKAISAGAMIALACNEIVVDPSAVIGDCAPIIFGEDGQMQALPPTERAKRASPVISDFRESAERNGYDVHLAEAMVAVEHPVYCLIDSKGNRHFANEKEKADLLAQGMKIATDLPNPVNESDALLTVSAAEALKLGLARGTADDAQDLAKLRDLTVIATLSPGWGETIVEFLASGIVRGLLITVFILALQVSLSAPGHGAAEATAILTLAVLLGIPLLTGYALWWEIMLIILGLALVAFEIFVFPGHFVSLVLGSMMFLFGLVLTFVGHDPGAPPWMPETKESWLALRDGLIFVAGGMSASALLGLWLSRYLPAIPYFRRLVLTAVTGDIHHSATTDPADNTASWLIPGTHGKAVSDLLPGGLAEFADIAAGDRRVISVVAEAGFIPTGSPVTVLESRGSYVIVRSAAARPVASTA